ncbi:MAG: right-handed parallel beta-helix repeat-containing protein [Phycisphaerales bacterium]|nr:MAG: right-handed parallel beta-helix repeat-containing protein [Phycisphaerales bacterium]
MTERRHVVRVVLAAILVMSTSAVGEIIYVDSRSVYDPGSGSEAEPFLRIQDALSAAAGGDIVEIRPGTYTGAGNHDLDTGGKSVTIRSIDGADQAVVTNTVVDAGGAGRVFCFQSGEDANCTVLGLTMQNGSSGFGGGLLCRESSPTFINCVIQDNSAIAYGGGVFCWTSDAKFIRCTVRGNCSDAGGGIECWSGEPEIVNCLIYRNVATGGDAGGGGVDCYDSGNAILRNCTVAGNSAPAGAGGGLLCVGSSATVDNCIFWANNAGQGSQLGVPSWFGIPAAVAVSYSDLQGGLPAVLVGPKSAVSWGIGNIDSAPRFAAFDPNGEACDWDFHLQSVYGCWDPNSCRWVADGNRSPCIDAGDPNSDWTGEVWPNGKRINAGAYGGTAEASLSGNAGDFDMNGWVDFEDFCEMANSWRSKENVVEDLNGDGVVGPADLGLFAGNWLWRRE